MALTANPKVLKMPASSIGVRLLCHLMELKSPMSNFVFQSSCEAILYAKEVSSSSNKPGVVLMALPIIVRGRPVVSETRLPGEETWSVV